MSRIAVKICGLSKPETLDAALKGGASHVGFIFFARSPRYVEPSEAAQLRKLATGKAKAVAVSVDAEDAFLDAIVSAGLIEDDSAPNLVSLTLSARLADTPTTEIMIEQADAPAWGSAAAKKGRRTSAA